MAGIIRQRGMGILALLYIIGTLCVGGLIAAQAFPTYTEYQAVLKATKRAAQGNTVPEIRMTFEKAAQVDNITSITGKDLEIGKGPGDQVFVKFAYNKEIHLFADVYMVIKYAGDSRTIK